MQRWPRDSFETFESADRRCCWLARQNSNCSAMRRLEKSEGRRPPTAMVRRPRENPSVSSRLVEIVLPNLATRPTWAERERALQLRQTGAAGSARSELAF